MQIANSSLDLAGANQVYSSRSDRAPPAPHSIIIKWGKTTLGKHSFRTAADAIVVERRKVDNPLETPAQLIAKRARSSDRHIGKIDVRGNAMTRIGALCFVRRRLRHHEQAAERFKTLYEGLYGSGMPAVDAGRIQVDTSIIAFDGGIAARIDRGAELRAIRKRIGDPAFGLLTAVVVLGIPCRDVIGRGGRALEDKVDELLALLDWLSGMWGYGEAA